MIDYDEDELELKLLTAAAELYGFDRLTADMPMHEIRARAEQAGMLFGRAIAAAAHQGPITADIAMEIKASEQIGKERFLASVGRLLGPGGELRETLCKKAGQL